MIISHKYKFIFIKTRKTAGSSVEKFLLEQLKGTDYIFAGMPPENMPPVGIEGDHEHVGWKFIKDRFPKEWETYYKFTIERNSWDKVVSLFYYIKSIKPKKVKHGFEAFVKSNNKLCFKDDWSLYTDNDQIVVDDIIIQDSINSDMYTVCKKIGLHYNNELDNKIRLKGNLRDNTDYKELYTNETKEIVSLYYKKPIEYFNFTF